MAQAEAHHLLQVIGEAEAHRAGAAVRAAAGADLAAAEISAVAAPVEVGRKTYCIRDLTQGDFKCPKTSSYETLFRRLYR